MVAAVADRNEILGALQANEAELKRFGVQRIGLFGSFVRDLQNDESDIDFLVEFRAACKTFDNFISLALFLEELLGRRVEIVTRESLSPYLGPHILNEVEYVTIAA